MLRPPPGAGFREPESHSRVALPSISPRPISAHHSLSLPRAPSPRRSGRAQPLPWASFSESLQGQQDHGGSYSPVIMSAETDGGVRAVEGRGNPAAQSQYPLLVDLTHQAQDASGGQGFGRGPHRRPGALAELLGAEAESRGEANVPCDPCHPTPPSCPHLCPWGLLQLDQSRAPGSPGLWRLRSTQAVLESELGIITSASRGLGDAQHLLAVGSRSLMYTSTAHTLGSTFLPSLVPWAQ